jgi:hypothetical protein
MDYEIVRKSQFSFRPRTALWFNPELPALLLFCFLQ